MILEMIIGFFIVQIVINIIVLRRLNKADAKIDRIDKAIFSKVKYSRLSQKDRERKVVARDRVLSIVKEKREKKVPWSKIANYLNENSVPPPYRTTKKWTSGSIYQYAERHGHKEKIRIDQVK